MRCCIRRLSSTASASTSSLNSVAIPNLKQDITLCLNSCRERDYSNFLISLFLPKEARPAFYALRCLNADLASIPEAVKYNIDIGKGRFQWWRKVISDIYQDKLYKELPVSRVLSPAIKDFKLTRRWFDRMIDARERDLENINKLPDTIADIEQYGENTAASMLYLSLELLNVREIGADHAASHIGKACAIVTLLRSLPYHLSQNHLYIPSDLVKKSEIHVSSFIKGDIDHEKLQEAVYAMACVAHSHLHHSREIMKDVSMTGRPALMISIWVEQYLEALEKVNFDVYHSSLAGKSGLKLQFHLFKSYYKGVY